jgi:hypothetical protein
MNKISYCVGSTGCGKSNFVKALLLKFQSYFDYGFAFVKTLNVCEKNKRFWKFLPKCFVSDTIRPAVISKIIEDQTDAATRRNVFLVFDDVIDEGFKNNKFFDQLFTTCRHHNLTIFFISQYTKSIGPLMRNQARCIFMHKLSDVPLNGMYELTDTNFGSKSKFCSHVQPCLVDNGTLIFDKDSKTYPPVILHTKAPLVDESDARMWFAEFYEGVCGLGSDDNNAIESDDTDDEDDIPPPDDVDV